MNLLLDSVSKNYSGTWAIRDLSVRVDDGESLVLLGPSGSGKTTVLRLVAGLEEPSAGDILFDGRPPSDEEPRDVTMLFAENRLFPKMTARQNIGFPLSVRGVPEPERTDRVEAEAATHGIERLLDKLPRSLSAGQANIVHLAKAMVRAPGLFLIDEPMKDLDPPTRRALRTELRALQRGYGATAMYATNDQEDAMVLADRILVIEKGTTAQVGTLDDIYQRPASRFVATFVGTPEMGVVQGLWEKGAVRVGDLYLTVPGSAKRSDVLVGVRAHHVVERSSGYRVKVDSVDRLGPDTYLHLIGPEGSLVMRSETSAAVGSHIEVDFKRFHLFDPESGVTLHHSTG